MNASVAIQVLPNVQDEEEVIRIVDEVIAYIRSTGLNYYVGPFETTIEGDYDQLIRKRITMIRLGIPTSTSMIRCITASTFPPKRAETAP